MLQNRFRSHLTNPLGNDPPSAVQASLEIVADKTFRISWEDSDNAEFYRVLENPDGVSGFTQISDDLALSTLTLDHRVALFRFQVRLKAQLLMLNQVIPAVFNSLEEMSV